MKIKRLFLQLVLLPILFGCVVPAPQIITPLQLQMMQTRKFKKPIDEVANAIKAMGDASGGGCAVPPTFFTPVITIQCWKFGKRGKVNSPNIYEDGEQSTIELTADNAYTIVRIKMYQKSQMVIDSKIYSNEFKKVSDALFMQGIVINPAEQD